jgi:hypothetical protein
MRLAVVPEQIDETRESAGNPLPTGARERGHRVSVLGDHLPVHQRLIIFIGGVVPSLIAAPG